MYIDYKTKDWIFLKNLWREINRNKDMVNITKYDKEL